MIKEQASVFIQQRCVIAVSHEIQSEFVRKSIHLLIAFVPFFAAVNITATLFLLGAGILLYTYAEFLRRNGKEFPLIVKLNSSDFLARGLKLEESIEIAKILEKEGIDAIEVSGGMAEAGKGSVWKGLLSEGEEGYFVDNAAIIKKALSIPVFALGGIRSFRVMEKIIEKGRSDLISLSRPFIRDPLMVMKFRTGMIQKSECISCNKCFNPRGISCGDLKSKKKTPKKD